MDGWVEEKGRTLASSSAIMRQRFSKYWEGSSSSSSSPPAAAFLLVVGAGAAAFFSALALATASACVVVEEEGWVGGWVGSGGTNGGEGMQALDTYLELLLERALTHGFFGPAVGGGGVRHAGLVVVVPVGVGGWVGGCGMASPRPSVRWCVGDAEKQPTPHDHDHAPLGPAHDDAHTRAEQGREEEGTVRGSKGPLHASKRPIHPSTSSSSRRVSGCLGCSMAPRRKTNLPRASRTCS